MTGSDSFKTNVKNVVSRAADKAGGRGLPYPAKSILQPPSARFLFAKMENPGVYCTYQQLRCPQ
jgi:hypothetical protein